MTKKLLVALPLLCSLAAVNEASAGSDVYNTTITAISIDKQYGNFAFIKLANNPTGSPSCATLINSWTYTLPLANPGDREIYAALLTAFAAGLTVSMSGTFVCSEHGFVESLQSFHVVK